MKKASVVGRILVSVITILFLFGFKLTSFAEESENNLLNTNVTLTVSQNLSVSTDGNKLSVSALVTDDEGQEIDASGALSIYYKKATDSDYKKFTSKSLSVLDGQIFYIYADFAGNDVYAATKSEEIVINVKKFASLKGNLEASATVSGKATGAINLSESYADFNLVTDLAYYRQGNPATTVVSGKSITGLSEGTYYVSVPARQEGNQIYIFSGNQSVKIEEGAQPAHQSLGGFVFPRRGGGQQLIPLVHIQPRVHQQMQLVYILFILNPELPGSLSRDGAHHAHHFFRQQAKMERAFVRQ